MSSCVSLLLSLLSFLLLPLALSGFPSCLLVRGCLAVCCVVFCLLSRSCCVIWLWSGCLAVAGFLKRNYILKINSK